MTTKSSIMIEAGCVLRDAFSLIQKEIQPGLVLSDLDTTVADYLKQHGARSVWRMQGFPGHISVSLNKELLQGIPNDRVLSSGDLLSVDLNILYKGFFTDKARTFPVFPAHYEQRYLAQAVEQCFNAGLTQLNTDIIRDGFSLPWRIGGAIESKASSLGVSVVRDLFGHGIGDEPHMKPLIPNFADHSKNIPIKPGDFLTIEPLVVYGNMFGVSYGSPTVTTRLLSAHWEDTIMITKQGAQVIT